MHSWFPAEATLSSECPATAALLGRRESLPHSLHGRLLREEASDRVLLLAHRRVELSLLPVDELLFEVRIRGKGKK